MQNKPNWIGVTSIDNSLAKSKARINEKQAKLDRNNKHR